MDDMNESPDGGPGLRRACDQCRLRKIRCNKESPCSNCRTANRQCSSTGVGQKPKEPRQRVLISSQYERKIDHFESRLGGIESLLRDLTTSISHGHHSQGADRSMSYNSSSYGDIRDTPAMGGGADLSSTVFSDQDDDDPTPEFEGNSSLAAQTAMASQLVENAVTQSALGVTNPNMQSALLSLKQIVQMQTSQHTKEIRFPNARPMPRGGIRELPMPPMSLVIGLLREIKDTPPLTFTLIAAFITIEEFTENCRKVYFATEDYSLATFILVNAGLTYLFMEKAMAATDTRSAELLKYHYTCRDNLETALSNLPLLMPARMETIKALLLGASYAVEIAKLTLAWHLNTSAALMCQALGYHRLPVNFTDSPSPSTPSSNNAPSTTTDAINDTKSGLFWFTYMLDKGLSLRFGRSSVIQDYDITLPKAISPQMNLSDPWKVVLNLWILQAELTGKVYEHLYSPSALSKPLETRVVAARQLAEDIKVLARESELLNKRVKEEEERTNQNKSHNPSSSIANGSNSSNGAPGGTIGSAPVGFYTMDVVLKSDEVWYWSSLALVYRTIPAINDLGISSNGYSLNMECLDAARNAIVTHHESMKLTEGSRFTQAAYLHWTLIYAPFAPFIVLFCNVIETSDLEDLRRMSEFVDSLAPVCSISEAIDKLHRVCQVLYNVAQLYVEAKSQQLQDQDMTMVNNDFDMYLSQLGFISGVPPDGNGGADSANGFGNNNNNNNNNLVGNWFSGNRTILGLVEADLSEFEPRGWASGAT
ncbi:hypothetical protein V8F33_007877 [Rhypophila sp. PSN 637]